jgi:hypothetical protein
MANKTKKVYKYDDYHLVNFKLTPEEFKRLTSYCEEHDMTKSGFIRKLIKKELQGYTPPKK